MILDSPHTLAPMLMRGNALVLKTPVENDPRTSIEKHLSWSPDIPPAAHFPLHRSRPANISPTDNPPPSARHPLQGGGVRSGPGAARTILLFHIISACPSKQSHLVRTFLKVCKSNHQPIGGSDPNHQGIWNPPRAKACVFLCVCVYYCRT
jgi:hypothetical protein